MELCEKYYSHEEVVKAMEDLRRVVDLAETKVDGKYWPIPTYTDLLFGI